MGRGAATKYGKWLSINTGKTYRLPTEKEWELACGAQIPKPLTDYAWFAANSGKKTQPVGKKKPNKHGVHDMLGNLWEYVSDPYSKDQPKRPVMRGGSWKNPAGALNSKSRLRFDDDWVMDDPNDKPGTWWIPLGSHLGFRVLRPGDAKKP